MKKSNTGRSQRGGWVVWTLLYLLLARTDASAWTAPPARAGVPFEFINRAIVVTVPTHEGELRLLLDTGASLVILTRQAQQVLHLKVTPTRLSAEEIHFSVGEVTDVRLGAVTLRRLAVFVDSSPNSSMMESWNKQHPEARIDGLLGLPALRTVAFGVDMPARRLLFWERGGLSAQTAAHFLTANSQDTPTSELHTLSCEVDANGIHVPAKIGAVTTSLTLDTGSATNVAGSRLAPYLRPLSGGLTANMERVFSRESSTMYAFSALTLDGAVFPCPWFTVYPKLDRKLDCGILGLDLLQDCRFIVDLPARKLHFLREAGVTGLTHEKLFQWGLASLNTPQGTIAMPRLDLPPNTGLKLQDVVIQIDHLPLDRILSWTATDTITLTVMRVERGAAVQREVNVPRTALQSVVPPAGEEVSLLPNEKVVYYFPNGALYVPPNYRGVVTRIEKVPPLPAPTGGYLLPNTGPKEKADYIRLKGAQQLENAATIYLHEPDQPIEIPPGSCWIEILDDPNRGVFQIAAPAKEPGRKE